MWGDAGFGWGWGMGFGMIGMVLFWGLVIFGIVVLVKRVGGSPGSSGTPALKTALDILDERPVAVAREHDLLELSLSEELHAAVAADDEFVAAKQLADFSFHGICTKPSGTRDAF